ncbi:MAG: hypothetical protein ACKV2U_21335 [Bryobacteraceae bacterium]
MKNLILIALTMAVSLAAGDKPKMTKAQHRVEAERHATRADELAAKALKHEANAERLKANQGYNAMRHKWPGLARGPENLERDRAMQARRAEAESRERLAFHAGMAEKLVEAEP